MRALVVDDSRFIREYLHDLFARRGVACVEASDGREALDRLDHFGPFAFALVDWNMPNMSGFEMLQQARANRSLDATRFIMMTTEAENDHIEAALLAGADEYMVKPFDEPGLLDKLRMAGIDGL
jgi:two-component system, chemotaxis family, chemotaxis protein CheY